MKAVRFREYGGIDVLRVEEVARPVPGPGQVLVEVASGIPLWTGKHRGAARGCAMLVG